MNGIFKYKKKILLKPGFIFYHFFFYTYLYLLKPIGDTEFIFLILIICIATDIGGYIFGKDFQRS